MSDYRQRHAAALLAPNTPEEQCWAQLLDVLEWVSVQYAADYVLREGVARMIDGAIVLLNAELGRLDGGMLWNKVHEAAEMIGYCLDHEKFDDDCMEGTSDD